MNLMTQDEFVWFCAANDFDDIEKAVKTGQYDLNKKGNLYGSPVTPIFAAAMEGHIYSVMILLDYGAEPGDGFTAAVITKNKELLEFMVNRGADINAKDSEGHTAMMTALISNDADIMKLLIKLGADVNAKIAGGHNILTYAAIIIADPKQKGRIGDKRLDRRIIPILMKAGSDYSDAMTMAMKTGSLKAAEVLIKNGADVNRKCLGSHSPLSIVMTHAENGIINLKMLRLLLENGADVNEFFDFGGEVAVNSLNIAISNESPEVAGILLSYGADPNIRDNTGRTSLVYAVLGSTELLRLLLNYGADPNIPDNEGRTALMLASIDRGVELEVIDDLIDAGADVNARDKMGNTALIWAVIGRDRSPDAVIYALIRTGGIRTKAGEMCCALASLYCSVKREIQLEVIHILIRRGADVNIIDSKGNTAFMYAVMNEDREIADILLSAGAEVDFDGI